MSSKPSPSRRAVLQGAGLAAVTVGAAAACGSDADDPSAGSTGSANSSASSSASPSASSSASASAGQGGAELASLADVPVGGGVVVAAQKVVLTQPTSGDIKAYSTRCTHQGCAVSAVRDGFIVCPCHNSRFAIADGAPTSDSPAKQPLAEAAVTVSGGKITLA